MWLLTNNGFFSVVQKTGTDYLTVRTRVKLDLDLLREKYLPDLSPTIANGGTDYKWRATVSHASFASALSKIALDIDYSNFKNEVAKTQGQVRAKHYGKVWSSLYDLPEDAPTPAKNALPWKRDIPAGKKVAYGGVIFDTEGRVLLREPKNHYDGYVWTFAKGRPDPGEMPEETALREVKEETGAVAKIDFPIPGEFVGGTTINRYFMMAAPVGSGEIADDDPETSSIKWLTLEGARNHIGKTTNVLGRQRDLAVLEAAVKLRT